MKNFVANLTVIYQRIFDRPWLHSSTDWRYAIGAGLLILLAAMINFDMRDRQWSVWQENDAVFFHEDTPLVSTTDAAYFLSLAEDMIEGESLTAFSSTQLYPENTEAYLRAHSDEYIPAEDRPMGLTDAGLLPAVIAVLAENFFDGNVGLAGHAMIAFTAFLTVAVIGGMFWAAGYPVEGALAGLGLGLSTTYVGRTSVGRIDTDQMMVTFLALSLMFTLLAARERNIARLLGYVLLSVIAVRLGLWWHGSANYLMLMPFLIFVAIVLQQQHFRHGLIAAGAFVLALNPLVFLNDLRDFFTLVMSRLFGSTGGGATETAEIALIFPDTFRTITEQARIDLVATLESMTGHAGIGVIGLIGFMIWALVRPSRGMIFLPFVIMGLLSVIAGRRYAFFAAPFIWFGFGWLMMTVSRLVLSYKGWDGKIPPLARTLTSLGFGAVLLIGTAGWLDRGYVPRATFDKGVTKTFKDVGRLAGSEGGIIATWWDYGYYAHFHSGGMATLHDGGNQKTPRTHLFARGLVSHNTGELIQISKFLATSGQAGIKANGSSLDALNQAIAAADNPDKPIYLVVTDQMSNWAGSIATLGRFDVNSGRYLSEEALRRQYMIVNLNCKNAGQNKLDCNHGLVDITHGTLNGNPVIGEIVLAENGYIKGVQAKNEQAPMQLVISKISNGSSRIQLIHRILWKSSLFQLLEQGRYDTNRLELVLDYYPVSRVYRIIR